MFSIIKNIVRETIQSLIKADVEFYIVIAEASHYVDLY